MVKLSFKLPFNQFQGITISQLGSQYITDGWCGKSKWKLTKYIQVLWGLSDTFHWIIEDSNRVVRSKSGRKVLKKKSNQTFYKQRWQSWTKHKNEKVANLVPSAKVLQATTVTTAETAMVAILWKKGVNEYLWTCGIKRDA